MRFLQVALFLLAPGLSFAVEHTGTVRAADQFIPGATVTARQGGAKLTTYTDENGRYAFDLTPGEWEIEIKMFGFKTLTAPISVKEQFTSKDWTLEMPRPGRARDSQAGSRHRNSQACAHGGDSRSSGHTRKWRKARRPGPSGFGAGTAGPRWIRRRPGHRRTRHSAAASRATAGISKCRCHRH